MIPGVPYDAEIEYLSSTNTQYIDTGIYGTNATSFEVSVILGSDGVQHWIGTWTSNYNTGSFSVGKDRGDNKVYFGYGGGSTVTMSSPYFSQGSKRVITQSGGVLKIDGITITSRSATFSSSPYTIYLFAPNRGGSAYTTSATIKYCKFWVSGVLVRDFIPVRVGQTGYMYDRVTKRLFGNNGTGSFVLGPDVAKPAIGLWGFKSLTAKDYISNGLVAMWDGIENAGWGRHTESPELFKELVGGQPVLVGGQFGSGLTTDPNYEITENGLKSNTVGGNYAIGVGVPFTTNLGSNWTIEWCRYAHSIPNLQAAVNTIMVYPYVDHNGRIWEYVNANESTFRQKYSGEWNTKVKESSGSGSTFAITCNPTTKRICYKNGTAGGTNGNAFYYYYSANTTHIGLGTNKTGATLYAFRIYNRALSASEMSFNHKIDKERFRL